MSTAEDLARTLRGLDNPDPITGFGGGVSEGPGPSSGRSSRGISTEGGMTGEELFAELVARDRFVPPSVPEPVPSGPSLFDQIVSGGRSSADVGFVETQPGDTTFADLVARTTFTGSARPESVEAAGLARYANVVSRVATASRSLLARVGLRALGVADLLGPIPTVAELGALYLSSGDPTVALSRAERRRAFRERNPRPSRFGDSPPDATRPQLGVDVSSIRRGLRDRRGAEPVGSPGNPSIAQRARAYRNDPEFSSAPRCETDAQCALLYGEDGRDTSRRVTTRRDRRRSPTDQLAPRSRAAPRIRTLVGPSGSPSSTFSTLTGSNPFPGVRPQPGPSPAPSPETTSPPGSPRAQPGPGSGPSPGGPVEPSTAKCPSSDPCMRRAADKRREQRKRAKECSNPTIVDRKVRTCPQSKSSPPSPQTA